MGRGRKGADVEWVRFQAFLTEEDAVWWHAQVGPEAAKPFRTARCLLDQLMRVWRLYVERLQAEGRVPVVPEGEWAVRINETLRPEDGELVERVVQPHGMSLREGSYLYPNKSALLADLVSIGRAFVPTLRVAEKSIAEGRAHGGQSAKVGPK